MRHILYRLGIWLLSHEYVKPLSDDIVAYSLKREVKYQRALISKLKLKLIVQALR